MPKRPPVASAQIVWIELERIPRISPLEAAMVTRELSGVFSIGKKLKKRCLDVSSVAM